MTKNRQTELDAGFIASQREKLLALRHQLINTGDAAGEDEKTLQDAAGDEPQDSVDDGDRLEQQSNDEALLTHAKRRLIAIDRALDKIKDGTYGVSDGNGELISREHLAAIPEAVYTSEELKTANRKT